MGDKNKILMIDDDVNLVDVFKMVFEAKGFDFSAAHSATEGLTKIKEVNPDLSIIIKYPQWYDERLFGF